MTGSRLRWRCRRGILELDLLLERFLAGGYEQLSEEGRLAFERLLDLPDQQLLRYVMGQEQPTDRQLADVTERIRHTPPH